MATPAPGAAGGRQIREKGQMPGKVFRGVGAGAVCQGPENDLERTAQGTGEACGAKAPLL